MKIFLIRHGQTSGDVEDRYGGDYDDHLTEVGKEQVHQVVLKLKNFGIELIFCSSRIRAKESAAILAAEIGCKVEIVDDMRERNMYGLLTGMVKSEAQSKHPEYVEALKSNRHSIPQSENYEHFAERVIGALSYIASQPYSTVAILTHGGPISFVFREMLGIDKIKIEDCGFAEIETDGTKFSIINMDGIEFVKLANIS